MNTESRRGTMSFDTVQVLKNTMDLMPGWIPEDVLLRESGARRGEFARNGNRVLKPTADDRLKAIAKKDPWKMKRGQEGFRLEESGKS